jgi:hypothetical protein
MQSVYKIWQTKQNVANKFGFYQKIFIKMHFPRQYMNGKMGLTSVFRDFTFAHLLWAAWVYRCCITAITNA